LARILTDILELSAAQLLEYLYTVSEEGIFNNRDVIYNYLTPVLVSKQEEEINNVDQTANIIERIRSASQRDDVIQAILTSL
jgi:hypothetical protein